MNLRITECSIVARGIRNSIIEQYPKIVPVIDLIIPKKAALMIGKWYFRTSIHHFTTSNTLLMLS
jgi:hypothetical protein